MLGIHNISVQYGERRVLDGVTFDLQEGEIVALLGANGAGKTTLIRAMNGTVPVAGGEIELDGERFPVKPMTAIYIRPGCRHRAVGKLKIINIPVPAFDESDEWFD